MRTLVSVFGLVLLVATGCGESEPPGDAETRPAPTPVIYETAEAFLDGGRGKVVVLLLGMQGCAKTHQATGALARLSGTAAKDVAFARLDVPPPTGTATPVASWSHPYPYYVDEDRAIAESLDFFYYPTLYLLDRDGEVRYSGGCETTALSRMIEEIRTEAPGGDKRFYTVPLPEVGTTTAGVRAKTMQGAEFDLGSYNPGGPKLLFFGSVGCPFSREAAESLSDLEIDFEDDDLALAVIEKGPDSGPARSFYGALDLEGPALFDPDGTICRSYGVEPVPFFFLVDADGKIAERGPYTRSAARNAVLKLLGRESEEPPTIDGAG